MWYRLGISPTQRILHVRHFFGDKVSIWTTSRQLLASQTIASVPGTWLDTSLPEPSVLSQGDTYLITVHGDEVERFWSDSLPTIFSQFPTQPTGASRFFVDLQYATDVTSVPITPGATANFTNGIWSGTIAMLQAATNIVLQVSAGPGNAGLSVPFNVLGTPKLVIANLNDSVVLSRPVAAAGFNVEQSTTLWNWTNAPGTPIVVGDRYTVTNALGNVPTFYRLQKP